MFSKCGHLSNRIIERFFFIFSKVFAVFEDFSNITWKNHQIYLAKIGGNKENLVCNFTFILMATFGTKNVHIAVVWEYNSKIKILVKLSSACGH